MIELKSCCRVPIPEKLFEQYQLFENRIVANINASKIAAMMWRFLGSITRTIF